MDNYFFKRQKPRHPWTRRRTLAKRLAINSVPDRKKPLPSGRADKQPLRRAAD